MMAEEVPDAAKNDTEPAVEKPDEATEKSEAQAAEKSEAQAAEPTASEDEDADQEPVFDPATCTGLAIGLDAFWEGVHSGEWIDTDLRYYLEPAGVLNGPLVCSRSPEDEPQRAGLLMTRAAWQAKKVALDDGVNPDTYELSFPKEFGYVKPLAHYVPETYEHAKYPWSKKY